MTMTDRIEALLQDARARLADAPRERLGRLAEPRRILGFTRAPRIVHVGFAWHLGALILTDDGLLATGEIIRARREAIRGFTAENQRRRSHLAAAAARGGIPEGEAVHVDWTVIPLDPPGEPLGDTDGVPTIRWSRAGARMPLARYLDDRITLLLDPPLGAT